MSRSVTRYDLGPELVAIQRLQNNPITVVGAAQHGSLTDLVALANNVSMIPEALRERSMEIFCSNFSSERLAFYGYEVLPCCDVVHPTQSLQAALFSLTGVANIYQTYGRPRSALADVVTRNWSAILASILQINKVALCETRQGADYKRKIVNAIASLFLVTEGLPSKPLSHEGAQKAIAQVWSHELLDNSNDPMVFMAFNKCYDVALNRNSLLEEVIVATPGGAKKVSKQILHAVQAAMIGSPIDYNEADMLVSALLMLTNVHNPFQVIIAKNHGVIIVTKILVSQTAVLTLLRRDMVPFIEGLIHFLFNAMTNFEDGHLWICQAFRYGFMEALLHLSPYFPLLSTDKAISMLKNLFGLILPLNLVYRSVVGVVVDSVSRFPASAYESKLGNSVLSREWGIFMNTLLERLILKRIYDYCSKHSPCRKEGQCAACKKIKKIRVCAQCKSVCYCSPECAKEGWIKLGHRAECKILAGAKQHETHTDRKNFGFLKTLATNDASRHAPGLLEMAQREYPNIPFDELGICVNYTTIPITLSLFNLDELIAESTGRSSSPSDEPLRVIDTVSEVRTDSHRKTLLKVLVKQGITVEDIFMISQVDKRLCTCCDYENSIRPSEQAVKRMGGMDGGRNVVEAEWDRVDFAIDRLGCRKPTDWLSSPDGDHVKAAHAKLDELIKQSPEDSFYTPDRFLEKESDEVD